MTSKIAAALAALTFAASAYAAPLHVSPAQGESAVQQIRYHRHGHYYFRCPVWYERTFWGTYRLYSPCSNRVTRGEF